jgi:hypothetical protein
MLSVEMIQHFGALAGIGLILMGIFQLKYALRCNCRS